MVDNNAVPRIRRTQWAVLGSRSALLLLLSYFFLGLCLPGTARSADVGNCLMCHRYRGLSVVSEEGDLRLFFVNEETWKDSVHTRVECEGCHTDIDQLPHEPAEKVDCLQECHIEDPASRKPFSHQHAADALAGSVHSAMDADGNPKPYAEDYPTCKECHDNPMYRPLSFHKKVSPGISDVAIGRCRVCHESDEFVYFYYSHVTTRLHRTRNPKNTAEVCARCHDDPEFVARHELPAPARASYEGTYHGKAADLLDESVPDCLDCHVQRGASVHEMLSHENPDSSTHPDHKGATCAQAECHPNVNPRAAEYQMHSTFGIQQGPFLFSLSAFMYLLLGGTLLPLFSIIILDLIRRHIPDAVFKFRGK